MGELKARKASQAAANVRAVGWLAGRMEGWKDGQANKGQELLRTECTLAGLSAVPSCIQQASNLLESGEPSIDRAKPELGARPETASAY